MTLFSPESFLSSAFMLVLCVSIASGANAAYMRDVKGAVMCSLLGCFAFFGMLLCWFWPLAGRLV